MSQIRCCADCPRQCHADRSTERHGFCGMADEIFISRAAPHAWEEPPISGTRGSGTVFFTGCNLRCVFCQNRVISHDRRGRRVSEDELADILLRLQAERVHNINLVTPTHYTDALVRVLTAVKPRLHIPVVWNSGGYDSAASLRRLEGLVDIYMPDFKYLSTELSTGYSAAPDYANRATEAITEMFRQTGKVRFDADGIMTRGVLVRHLVLPGCRKDSIAVIRHLATVLPPDEIRLSVMRQYTPEFAADCPYPNLHRRLTDFEYESVLVVAGECGFAGYRQGKEAAVSDYTPDFLSDMPEAPDSAESS